MTENTTTLFCNYGSNKLDIPLWYHENMATLDLDPGYQNYKAFESVLKYHTILGPLILESTVFIYDEDDQYYDVPPPANTLQKLWYQITGLPIWRTQAE